MNIMKRQKDMTLKDELPRWVGAQYAPGYQCRNKSRKNEANAFNTKIMKSVGYANCEC